MLSLKSLLYSQITVKLKHKSQLHNELHCTTENLFVLRQNLTRGAAQAGGFKTHSQLKICLRTVCTLISDEVFSRPVWTVKADPVGLKVLIPTGSACTKYSNVRYVEHRTWMTKPFGSCEKSEIEQQGQFTDMNWLKSKQFYRDLLTVLLMKGCTYCSKSSLFSQWSCTLQENGVSGFNGESLVLNYLGCWIKTSMFVAYSL